MVIPPGVSPEASEGLLQSLVKENPFTPLEIIWVCPAPLPDAASIVNSLPLSRPHFLDLDLALLEETPGNRAILTTLIQDGPGPDLNLPMTRTLRRFTLESLPDDETLKALEGEVDGILIDSEDGPELEAFQAAHEERACETLPMAFSDERAMARWRRLSLHQRFIQW